MGSERGRGRAHRALEVDGRSTSLDLLECGELKWMWASCCLLPPQAEYPAPGCRLAEELQENCECPRGVRWEYRGRASPSVCLLQMAGRILLNHWLMSHLPGVS